MKVKVCDFADVDFQENFVESLKTTGFAVITNPPIEHKLIKEAQMAWKLFFLNSLEYKKDFVTNNPNMGYTGMRQEHAIGAKKPDLKEFFHWQPGANVPLEVASETMIIYSQLEGIGLYLLSILSEIGPRTDYMTACAGSDNTIIRSLYYPAMDFSQEPDAVRAAAHEDINFITLLVAASAPGLQVLDKDGNWHDVPHEQNSIIVNVGDQLQLASNGLYKSTTHRVINPDNSRSDRISMPLFMHPNSDTMLTETISAQQYLEDRLKKISVK